MHNQGQWYFNPPSSNPPTWQQPSQPQPANPPTWQQQPSWYETAPPRNGHGAAPPFYGASATPMQPISDPFGNSVPMSAPVIPDINSGQEVEDFENEPPLLEELGIFPEEIAKRLVSVLFFRDLELDIEREWDLTGPILVLVALACALLLAGKVHFGYVYALSTYGSLSIWALLNLLSKNEELIDVYKTLSILGYGLVPLVGLAVLAIFVPLKAVAWGTAAAGIAALWCTVTATKFFERVSVLRSSPIPFQYQTLRMENQRYLVAYPVFLFYASFVLLTIF